MSRRPGSRLRRRLRRLTVLGGAIGGVAVARAATLARQEQGRPDLTACPEALGGAPSTTPGNATPRSG